MTCLRCTKCDVRYPNRPQFRSCPECKISTGRVSGEPDDEGESYGLEDTAHGTRGRAFIEGLG